MCLWFSANVCEGGIEIRGSWVNRNWNFFLVKNVMKVSFSIFSAIASKITEMCVNYGFQSTSLIKVRKCDGIFITFCFNSSSRFSPSNAKLFSKKRINSWVNKTRGWLRTHRDVNLRILCCLLEATKVFSPFSEYLRSLKHQRFMEIPLTIIILIRLKWILIIRNQIHIISDYHVVSKKRNSINSLFNRLSARDIWRRS